jgi:enolase
MKVARINVRRGASSIIVNVTDEHQVELIASAPAEKLTKDEASELSRALKAAVGVLSAVEEI